MNPRLNRLFAPDGRCVILAFDHGLFGEPSWLTGVANIPDVLSTHVAEKPDGMTLTTGSARILQAMRVDRKPSLILRADVTNSYLGERPAQLYAARLAEAVDRASALDAVCVVAALLTFPDQPSLRSDCLRSVDELRARCDQVGMPLLVETLAMTLNDGVPKVSTDVPTIATLVRQAFEAGADVVKADPPEPAEEFAMLLDAAGGLPVLASGGIPTTDEKVVRRTAAVMAAGASGIAYGRNVLWAADPALMTRTLISIVHGGVCAENAVAALSDPAASPAIAVYG